jgi:hypothetical protein
MIKSTPVTVLDADGLGNVIVMNYNKPDYGYIRVTQRVAVVKGNWFRYQKRYALLSGTMEDLVDAGFKAGQELPGRIVRKEALQPFNPVNPEKDLKRAGRTGIICCACGLPIYQQSFFTAEPGDSDELIEHTNRDEIRDALKKLREEEQEEIIEDL